MRGTASSHQTRTQVPTRSQFDKHFRKSAGSRCEARRWATSLLLEEKIKQGGISRIVSQLGALVSAESRAWKSAHILLDGDNPLLGRSTLLLDQFVWTNPILNVLAENYHCTLVGPSVRKAIESSRRGDSYDNWLRTVRTVTVVVMCWHDVSADIKRKVSYHADHGPFSVHHRDGVDSIVAVVGNTEIVMVPHCCHCDALDLVDCDCCDCGDLYCSEDHTPAYYRRYLPFDVDCCVYDVHHAKVHVVALEVNGHRSGLRLKPAFLPRRSETNYRTAVPRMREMAVSRNTKRAIANPCSERSVLEWRAHIMDMLPWYSVLSNPDGETNLDIAMAPRTLAFKAMEFVVYTTAVMLLPSLNMTPDTDEIVLSFLYTG